MVHSLAGASPVLQAQINVRRLDADETHASLADVILNDLESVGFGIHRHFGLAIIEQGGRNSAVYAVTRRDVQDLGEAIAIGDGICYL